MIVELLLVKDGAKRPLVSDLLMTPFAKKKMEEFIANGGFIGDRKLHVRKVRSKKIEASDPESSPGMTSADSKEESKTMGRSKSYQDEIAEELTPKEKMLLKKQREADKKAKQLNEYTRGAITNYSKAKKQMYEEFHNDPSEHPGGGLAAGHKSYKEDVRHSLDQNKDKYSLTEKGKGGVVIGDKKKVMVSNYCEDAIDEQEEYAKNKFQASKGKSRPVDYGDSGMFGDSFAANDRCEETLTANDR